MSRHIDSLFAVQALVAADYLENYPRAHLTTAEAIALGSISALNVIGIQTAWDGQYDTLINETADLVRQSPDWKSGEAKLLAPR